MKSHKVVNDNNPDTCSVDGDLVIHNLPYPACLVDTNMDIVKSNLPFQDIFMSGPESRTRYHVTLHNSDVPVRNCPLKRSAESMAAEEEKLYFPALGTFLNVHVSPLIQDGYITGFLYSLLFLQSDANSSDDNSDLIEVYADSVNAMKTRELKNLKVKDAFFNMLEDVNESYQELEELFLKLVRVMVSALDTKSPWTKGHSERVSLYAEKIAREMKLDEDGLKDIKLAGLLHDIGKIGTYDYLLDKPGRLTSEEFEIVKKHPSQGAEILKGIKQLNSILPFIVHHHEKLDGNGYPNGLTGDIIPLGARILHVADSFDSMTSDRPYRKAPGIEYALSEMEKYKGIQFDHHVVDAFLNTLQRK